MSKVLIADDDSTSCALLSSLLTKWGYQAEVVHNGDDALRNLLKPDAPQLAILDWIMPGTDGIQVIKSLRATHREPYTYVLLVTSKGQKEDLLEGLEAGADDYLKKPFDAQELRVRLRVGARIVGLEHRLQSAMETPEYRATHDPLTGLYGRAAIIDVLNREASRCERNRQKVSVLFAEIDQFADINKTYGHAVGEQIIKLLAPKMGSDLRPYDSIGRFGTEQFVIVAPNCTLNHAMVVADRLRLRVAKDKLAIEQSSIAVTVTVGVSTIGKVGVENNEILQQLDRALHESKKKGPNRVDCFDCSESPPIGMGVEKNAMVQRSKEA